MMVEADERSRVEQSVQRIPNCNLPSGSQEYSTDILPSKSRGTRQSRGLGVLGKGRTEPSVGVQRQYDLHAHTCHASVQASYNAAPGSATICVDWCVCVSVRVRACVRACMRAHCGCVNACHWHALVRTNGCTHACVRVRMRMHRASCRTRPATSAPGSRRSTADRPCTAARQR